jgi:hypothetical protein
MKMFYGQQLLTTIMSDELQALFDEDNDARFKNLLTRAAYIMSQNSEGVATMYMLRRAIYK